MSGLRRRLRPLNVLLVSLSAGALLWPACASAQWVWKDANGRVNASDLPPPRDTPEKNILQRPEVAIRRAPAAQPASGPGTSNPSGSPALEGAKASGRPGVDPELEKRRKALEAARPASQAEEDPTIQAQRRDNCQRARNMLTALEGSCSTR